MTKLKSCWQQMLQFATHMMSMRVRKGLPFCVLLEKAQFVDRWMILPVSSHVLVAEGVQQGVQKERSDRTQLPRIHHSSQLILRCKAETQSWGMRCVLRDLVGRVDLWWLVVFLSNLFQELREYQWVTPKVTEHLHMILVSPGCHALCWRLPVNLMWQTHEVKNLAERGCPLLSVFDYPSMEAQKTRFLERGWSKCSAPWQTVFSSRHPVSDADRPHWWTMVGTEI